MGIDTDYYRDRECEERKAARAAVNRRVEQLHLTLAQHYLTLRENAERSAKFTV